MTFEPLVICVDAETALGIIGQLARVEAEFLLERLDDRRFEQYERGTAGVNRLHPFDTVLHQFLEELDVEPPHLGIGHAQARHRIAFPVLTAEFGMFDPEGHALTPAGRRCGHCTHAKAEVDVDAHAVRVVHHRLKRVLPASDKVAKAVGCTLSDGGRHLLHTQSDRGAHPGWI